MRKDLILNRPIYSSFFSCDKDIEKILKVLFVDSKPYSDILKRLLIINNKDCLDKTNEKYQKVIDSYSVAKMIEEDYIRLNPKIARGTHEDIKTYLLISLDDFSLTRRSEHYMDYIVRFEIVCYNDAWLLDNYKIRPLAICGYIDGILNSLTNKNKNFDGDNKSNIKLTGIGQYRLISCKQVVLNEDFSMYSLNYYGINFSEMHERIGNL